MVTFIIVAAAMLIVFLMDYKTLTKSKQPKVMVFYSILTAISLAIIALYCFGVKLPSIYGF